MKIPPLEAQAVRDRKQQRLERWKRERERGVMSWVLRRGVLAYGVPLCAFFVGMQWGQYHRAIGMILLLNIPIWLLIGSLFGVLTWYAMEVLYSRHR